MLNFFIVMLPVLVGLVSYTVLRRRDTQPLLSGCVSMIASIVVMAGIFAAIVMTGTA